MLTLTQTGADPPPTQTDTEGNIILRPSYGAMFQRVGQLDNSVSHWYHTVAIPHWRRRQLPVDDNLCREGHTGPGRRLHTAQPDMNLAVLHQLCTAYKDAFDAYNTENQELINKFFHNQAVIRDLLPLPITSSSPTRNKRTAIPVVGRLARSLFGMATIKVIKTVQRSVEAIAQQTQDQTDTILQLQDELQSYQIAVNDRITNMRQATQLNYNLLNETITKLINWQQRLAEVAPAIREHGVLIDWTQRTVSLLHVYGIRCTDWLCSLVQESYLHIQAIHTLLQGYLPAHLIPAATLKPILNHIRRLLQVQYPNFALTHSDVALYYHLPLMLYAHSSKYLYIILRIPITTSDMQFNLY